MNRITRAVRWAIWPLITGMFIAVLAIQIFDRFAYDGIATTFYVTKADVTCVSVTVHGKPAMWCVDGDTTGQLELKP